MLSQAKNTNSYQQSPKTLFKNLFFRKLFSLSILHTNSNPLVKNCESPPIKSPCSRSHTDSRLIGLIIITQREVLYKSVFLVQKRSCTRCCCLLGVRGVVHIWQRVFCQVVYNCWFWVYPNQETKISSGLLGDWTQVTRIELG